MKITKKAMKELAKKSGVIITGASQVSHHGAGEVSIQWHAVNGKFTSEFSANISDLK